jgi:tRNA wybutosine-synthesizing protein 2
VTEQLAAVVERSRAEAATGALRAEGVYDDTRSVFECGPETVGLPVTRPPAATDVLRVVVDETQTGSTTLSDLLRDRGWSETELERVPESWAVVGGVVLVRVADCPRPTEVGEALLALVGGADTVLAQESVEGPRGEPDVTVLAGEGDTETVHHERGIEYAVDLATVPFLPHRTERARRGKRVTDGEHVLDTSAGAGSLTLPMAQGGATVTAVERDAAAFSYLVENVVRNGVADSVETYRADCREVVEGFAPGKEFDRVVVGRRGARSHLADVLPVLGPGGTAHVYATTPDMLLPERPARRVRRAATAADRSVDSMEIRRVGGDSEGVSVVVDAVVT